MHPDWLRDLRDQALTAGIALFVKQLGSNRAVWSGVRHLKGEDPAEWPADLRIQDFPRGKDRRPLLAPVHIGPRALRRASASARTCCEGTHVRALRAATNRANSPLRWSRLSRCRATVILRPKHRVRTEARCDRLQSATTGP